MTTKLMLIHKNRIAETEKAINDIPDTAEFVSQESPETSLLLTHIGLVLENQKAIMKVLNNVSQRLSEATR